MFKTILQINRLRKQSDMPPKTAAELNFQPRVGFKFSSSNSLDSKGRRTVLGPGVKLVLANCTLGSSRLPTACTGLLAQPAAHSSSQYLEFLLYPRPGLGTWRCYLICTSQRSGVMLTPIVQSGKSKFRETSLSKYLLNVYSVPAVPPALTIC